MDVIDLLECGDTAALEALGARFARRRLNRNLTQQALANEAGVSRKTVSHLENGSPVTTVNLVRVLRALGEYRTLDNVLPHVPISPLDLVKLQGKERQRARGRSDEASSQEPWNWRE
ncbi:helix-turn-helix transcriptional regulator [Salinisphaera sp.]|jgi:transcriptional regulator with XRE-family HTH domain|uniref:helix-turn-helix domain-containing protein n=1 Tax=Salinisphaera sp. TaxID=1914330 RepID=UPI000C4AAB81|nr:helix-turn-helix transcriptional regulator [Salinisphaera sp.]MBS61878.1 transcriptional regulator [Salinisphaera sp.]